MKYYQISFISTFFILLLLTSLSFSQITFTEHPIVSNYNAWSVVGIDMDQDGDIDIVGSARLTSRIDWWENDGKQNYTRHPISQSAPYAMGIQVADQDGDKDLDVVCGLNQSKKLKWYENDGNQNFSEHTIADWVVDLVHVADINKDGLLDIVASACEQGDNKMGWFENTGNKTFVEHVVRSNWDHANSVYAADLDSDGDVDFLGTASFRTTATYGEIAWFENDGKQNFVEHNIKRNFGRPSQVCAADVDGDGDMDVLATVCQLNQIMWFENDSSQNFMQHTIGTNFVRPRDVHAIDFDQDGDMDILGAAIDSHEISWWENDGEQNFIKNTVTTNFRGATEIFLTDVDQDGDLDILGAAQFANKISWFENNSAPSEIKQNENDVASNPVKFSLLQNYPNPFNSITQIAVDLPVAADLELQIFDMTGKLVKTLTIGESCAPGNHTVQWNGTDNSGTSVSSGIYVCQLMTKELSQSAKLVLLK